MDSSACLTCTKPWIQSLAQGRGWKEGQEVRKTGGGHGGAAVLPEASHKDAELEEASKYPKAGHGDKCLQSAAEIIKAQEFKLSLGNEGERERGKEGGN